MTSQKKHLVTQAPEPKSRKNRGCTGNSLPVSEGQEGKYEIEQSHHHLITLKNHGPEGHDFGALPPEGGLIARHKYGINLIFLWQSL